MWFEAFKLSCALVFQLAYSSLHLLTLAYSYLLAPLLCSTGTSRGFAFVRYRHKDEAQKAIDRLDGTSMVPCIPVFKLIVVGLGVIRCTWLPHHLFLPFFWATGLSFVTSASSLVASESFSADGPRAPEQAAALMAARSW